MTKPSAGGEAAGRCSRPAPRGYEGQRAPKDQSRILGGPDAPGPCPEAQAGIEERQPEPELPEQYRVNEGGPPRKLFLLRQKLYRKAKWGPGLVYL